LTNQKQLQKQFTRKHEIFYGGRNVGCTPFQTSQPIASAIGLAASELENATVPVPSTG